MFIDGVDHTNEAFRKDAEALSKSFLAVMKHYQSRRPTPELIGSTPVSSDLIKVQAGKVTVHCIFAANVFSLAVLIKELPQRERRQIREYMVTKFDEALRDIGA